MKTRTKVGALALSAAALVGIATSEDFVGPAYQDIVGIWTYGFGSTTRVDGKPVTKGDSINPVAALQLKMRDVQNFEGALKSCVKVPLSQGEFDSFLSLAYNIGPGAFCKSTLVRKVNAGDYEGACKEILRWNKAGGKEVRGLTLRREREYKQCIGE
jgi:lysozyme